MNSKINLAIEQGWTLASKNRIAQSLRPCDLPKIRAALKQYGLLIRSPVLPYWLSLEIIGGTKPAPKIADHFSVSPNDFEPFIPGTSEEQLVKVLYESAPTIWFPELQRVIERLTGYSFPFAAPIDYQESYKEQNKLSDSIRRALLKGRARDVGVARDLWKEGTAPVGRPETAKLKDISYQSLPSTSTIKEWAVMWRYRSVQVQIGQLFTYGDKSSLVLDGRPYRYLGHECKVGKKNLLLVKMSGKLKARIREEVTSKFCQKLAVG